MQLIIIYNNSTIINNINPTYEISYLKKLIEDRLLIPVEEQILYYGGKTLKDDYCIEDYQISNNAIIFLQHQTKGGNVEGFPDVGKLIVLLSVSTLMLLLAYLFFDNILEFIQDMPDQRPCLPTRATINSELNMNMNMSGGAYDNSNLWYRITSMFYFAVVVIIITIYTYTVLCNHTLSGWLIVAAVASLLVSFFIFYFSYKWFPTNIQYISTIAFGTLGMLLILLTFIVPAWNNSSYMHWTTYLYPIGVVITVVLINYINQYTDWTLYIKILALLATTSLFIFIPYIMAYIFNIAKLCI